MTNNADVGLFAITPLENLHIKITPTFTSVYTFILFIVTKPYGFQNLYSVKDIKNRHDTCSILW